MNEPCHALKVHAQAAVPGFSPRGMLNDAQASLLEYKYLACLPPGKQTASSALRPSTVKSATSISTVDRLLLVLVSSLNLAKHSLLLFLSCIPLADKLQVPSIIYEDDEMQHDLAMKGSTVSLIKDPKTKVQRQHTESTPAADKHQKCALALRVVPTHSVTVVCKVSERSEDHSIHGDERRGIPRSFIDA
ncbi:hypothetical protein BKA80DRAFT_52103 [Phyllosticta citrichinensis]